MNQFNIQPLIVLLLLFFTHQFPVSHSCHDHERTALLSFKSYLTDPSNRLSSWQVGQNCCNWHGIHCSHDDSFHVVAVDLRNTDFDNYSEPINALNGTISPSLFTLTHLQYLDLSFNNFQYSKIPHQFAYLKDLTYLNLSNSIFSGSITTQFANLSSLRYLDISSSFLDNFDDGYRIYLPSSSVSSTDTSWLRGLVNLKVLRLTGVDLSMASSATNWAEPISFLADLRQLDLSNCRISSPVPIYNFLNLSRLSSLRMGSNFLNSSIPIQLANLTSLSVLDLTHNQLQGSISHLPQLRELYVGENRNLNVDLARMFDHQWPAKLQALWITSTNVTGPIPSSISNASLLVSLHASHCGIQGPLPVSISNLSQLQYLDLSGNKLQGPLPVSISNLSQLQYLDLSGNKLQGPLPVSISNLSQLQYLDLRGNKLQGPIPESICEMSFLQVLDLTGNNVTGTIPSCIGKLRHLYRLYVSDNSIGGTVSLISLIDKLNLTHLCLDSNNITVEIDQYPPPSKFQLQVLRLKHCNLKGYIPTLICNFTQLDELNLAGNNLTGVIPSCIFKLPNLFYLDLSSNNLQGTLPHSLNNRLSALILANNNLRGLLPLPPQYLFAFDLSHNKFTGRISTELGERLNNYTYVSLSGNKFSGSIPFSICSKGSFLWIIDLSNNSLSGSIPSTLEYCTSLVSLNLGMNNLTGNIPNGLEQAHKYLTWLQLNDNTLNGTFPHFIQRFQNLEVLKLGNNKFEGSIPTFIGSLRNLKIISLRSNVFNGSIPKEITRLHQLQILDLSKNKLSGPIPEKVGDLKMLTSSPNSVALSPISRHILFGMERTETSVELEMVIKGTIRQFASVYSYNSGIDLSCNILEGNIPQEIVLLKGLGMLNLSHNRFSGMIPMNVGNMTGLESLDLSFNKFSGHIPQSLTSIDSLGSLKLSYNNLSGRIPTGPHFDTLSVDGSAYVGNTFLCGPPTNNRCEGNVNTSSRTDASLRKDDEDASEKWLFYGVVFLGYGVGFWGLFFVLLLRKEKWWFGYWRVVDIVAARLMVGCMRKN